MIVKTVNELRAIIENVLLATGADKRNAEVVAEHLVLSNLSGVDTHGVWMLPGYVANIKAGEIVPTAQPSTVRETPSSALVTGNWGFGHLSARYAMEKAIEKAKSHSVAVVSLVQAHHVGRLGHYTEMAASEGMISMLWFGGYERTKPRAVPYGGRKPVLDTNPISIGCPAGNEPPMIMDFATAALSGVKVILAQRRGQQLPANCIVDRQGNPSTDPNDFFDGGGFLPFGGHKGYALMLAAELLGPIFVGSDAFVEGNLGGTCMAYQGGTMIVFKADLFQPLREYAKRADEMARRVRAVPPAAGFEEVLIPGDLEARTRIIRQREGIPIEDDVWQSIVETAASVGINNI